MKKADKNVHKLPNMLRWHIQLHDTTVLQRVPLKFVILPFMLKPYVCGKNLILQVLQEKRENNLVNKLSREIDSFINLFLSLSKKKTFFCACVKKTSVNYEKSFNKQLRAEIASNIH